MNIITNFLRSKNSSCALVPFITAGYPNINISMQALKVLDKKGADLIELGIPYSDALADGPIIQEASQVALRQGIYIDQVLYILRTVVPDLSSPIIIFTYYNPILVRGVDKFIREMSQAGAKGLIIPDLPLEEVDYILELCNLYCMELILFIAPTSSESRIQLILSKSPGCIYLVSSCGVTGFRDDFDLKIQNLAAFIKSKTDKLIMLGFGINSPDQVSQIISWDIDGIVVGSAMINHMVGKFPKDILDSLGDFCQKLKFSMSKKNTIE
uniref:Tryptophan synthase alpha chain n=1 Tax=Gracilaria vermiculophylla TaxID=2608709 RepID=A0A345U8T7_9FLOR|nr:tryptophan synthase alpha subunit [Gracilaria vermiculophylla]AXI96873.1 tryptophan synthase alpha subunit [Gracilaria vermiculophylla]QXU75086.1 tryptophan synthase alpha subunit [Gracilaria vermiculophylla]WDZ67932.1 tryptophan synthase alpha subunit [Gracilaria vermiculophylla]